MVETINRLYTAIIRVMRRMSGCSLVMNRMLSRRSSFTIWRILVFASRGWKGMWMNSSSRADRKKHTPLTRMMGMAPKRP